MQAYKEDGQITLEDIEEVVPKTLQDNIFDLTQMILKRQIDQARNLVKDLRLQGEDEIKLIAILLGQFRMFSQVKIFSRRRPIRKPNCSELVGVVRTQGQSLPGEVCLYGIAAGFPCPFEAGYDDLHRDGLCN